MNGQGGVGDTGAPPAHQTEADGRQCQPHQRGDAVVQSLARQTAQDRADFLGVYRGNLSALDLLVEISSRVPEELEVGLEEIAIDRQAIRMKVSAKNFQAADRLGAEFQKFDPFVRTKIGAIETDARTGGKRFSVTISLRPEESRG